MLSRGQGPIWQEPERCERDDFNENDKRAIRDYMNDLEMIVWVVLEELGLPEMVVDRMILLWV